MKRDLRSYDILLVVLACAVAIFGIIMIGSATHIKANGPSDEYRSQQIWFASGVVLMIIASFIDYHFICKFYIIGYMVNFILLAVLLVLGSTTEGVSRWININGMSLQPSEFSKIFMIVFLARFIDNKKESINKPGVIAVILAAVAVPVYMIFKQPSLSASIVIVFITVCMVYVAKISYKYILIVLAITIPVGTFVYFDIHKETPFVVEKHILDSYMVGRILSVLHPDAEESNTYQTDRSIRVIASGRMEGKGLYNGIVNKINYVPESQNDFIFAVIGEELGFLGSTACIGVMLLIIFKCVLIAGKAPDMTGSLLAVGVASMLAFQTFVNIGVATGVVPNTGMPLPFISTGGSSMWSCMIGIGLCVNVGMYRMKAFFE